MKGTLYGVGVGPGDPELMTVKAWRLISTAKVIAYLAANGGESTARAIAAPFLPDDAEELAIDMPMRVEPDMGRAAYDRAAERIAVKLDGRADVVMLCEGDPFLYGSFMYVFERLAGRYRTSVVPGVTSITACAAEMGTPLCGRDEVLKILPATLDAARLRDELSTAQSAAIIKVGRHLVKVKSVLADLGMTDGATAISHATQQAQQITPLQKVDADALPYFTTIIVKTR
jgi:precorrin-2/cobalt-factor-2 C20-methyltransferase